MYPFLLTADAPAFSDATVREALNLPACLVESQAVSHRAASVHKISTEPVSETWAALPHTITPVLQERRPFGLSWWLPSSHSVGAVSKHEHLNPCSQRWLATFQNEDPDPEHKLHERAARIPHGGQQQEVWRAGPSHRKEVLIMAWAQ